MDIPRLYFANAECEFFLLENRCLTKFYSSEFLLKNHHLTKGNDYFLIVSVATMNTPQAGSRPIKY
jgi:hypothetical protein